MACCMSSLSSSGSSFGNAYSAGPVQSLLSDFLITLSEFIRALPKEWYLLPFSYIPLVTSDARDRRELGRLAFWSVMGLQSVFG